jgi:hypothetical protein
LNAYATVSDLVNYMGPTAEIPADAKQRIAGSEVRVRNATKLALYPVDENDDPRDDFVVAAFRDAVCADAQARIIAGLPEGTVIGPSPMREQAIPGATIQYQIDPGAQQATNLLTKGQLAPTALLILDNVGLLNGSPTSIWAFRGSY